MKNKFKKKISKCIIIQRRKLQRQINIYRREIKVGGVLGRKMESSTQKIEYV